MLMCFCSGLGACSSTPDPATGSGGMATGQAGTPTAGSLNASGSGGVPSVAGTTSTAGSGSGGSPTNGGAVGVGGASGSASNTAGSGGVPSGGSAAAGGSAGATAGGGGGGGMGGSASTCPPATPLTSGMKYCSNSKGKVGNYAYELWAEGSGTGCMTVHNMDATFSATWDGVEDFLARVGLDFNQTQTHTQVGTITAEFAEQKEENSGGLTYVGIYGWTVSPLHEFYILEDWGGVKPAGTASDGTPRDFVGTLDADGETYDVWKKTRVDKPAITGDHMTFDQYFSIRRTARQCGTISVSTHFTKWEALGLPLGKLYEVKLLLEAQDNGGKVAFTKAKVVATK
jgi:endo-1,4-beta-xylanase